MAGQDAPAVRVSDEDRARAAGRLDVAVADGRLTWSEHGRRSELVWSAVTRAELLPQLADLGEDPAPLVPQRVHALGSKIVRTPEGCRRVEARAVFGAVVLDLSGLRPGEQVLVEASSFCGKVVLTVPPDAVVLDEGDAVLGKRTVLGTAVAPGGPVVRLTGRSTLGHLKVFRD